VLKVKKFAACSFMATVLVVSTLLSPFSAVSTASAEDAGHLTPGIYKPTPIGIGTNINVSTSDPGVATYVGRDMYIGGKPSDTNSLDASNAPAGSYAAEAEGLTVVRGKLAMNPIKESWSGHGFRFGTVGFGSQFRPGEGSTVLAVAGIDSAITSMSVGYSGDTPQATTVGAWTKGAWVGKATTGDSAGYEYTAQIAGPITYWNTNKQRQSVVKTQSNWSDGGLFSGDDNGASIMSNINGKDYTKYLQSEVKAKISAPLAKLKTTGEYKVGVAEQNSKYMIKKYNNKEQYGLTFDDSIKTFKRKTNYTDVNGKNVSGEVALVNNEKLIKFTGDADANGNGSPLQVFYLKASDLTNSIGGTTYRGVDFSFDMIPTDASVVVNIIDDDEAGQTATPVEFNTGWRFWWNGKEISRGYEEGSDVESQYSTAAQSILWNFTTAKQVTIRGGMALEGNKDLDSKADGKWTDDDPAAAMLGSIVVPNGSFEDHVTTNGRVYVGGDFEMYNPTEAWKFNPDGSSASVIDMDQERHNFPWSGSYTPDGSSIAWSKVDAADGTKLLPGSSWTIYGTVKDAKNGTGPIVTVTDGAANDYASTDGKLQFNYLNQKADPSKEISDSNPAFTYYIKEETAPEGYQVSDKIYYATMNNAGESVNYVQGYVDENGNEVPFTPSNTTGAIANTKITGTVSWAKVEKDDAEHTPLAGSEWKLAKLGADGLIEAQSWTVSDQSTPSETTWADTDAKDGKFTLADLLPGTYTLTETQAPFGYELNKNTYKFTVDSTSGSITWIENEQPNIVDGITYISDSCSVTSVKIPVIKSVRNTDWPKDSSGKYVAFDFSIEATGPNKDSAPMPDSKTISVAPADSTKVNDIEASFGEISFSKEYLATNDASNPTGAKTYTYTVKEVAPNADAIDKLRYSKAEYQVAVTVKAVMVDGKYTGLTTSTTVTQVKDDMGNALGENGQGVVVQPSAAAPDAIPTSTFTNVKVLTDLPLTGAGWTENSMLLVGAGLMLLSGIAAGAYWFATKRRQDDPSDGAGR
jgi:cell surface protein with gram positive anchor and cna protein B-type domains